MNEIITVGGVNYTATNIITGMNTISFTLASLTEDEAKTVFKSAESLTVGDGETVYGEYLYVRFDSITVGADDDITVTMHIMTDIEKQIKELQISQDEQDKAISEQDEAIAEILFGGGEA